MLPHLLVAAAACLLAFCGEGPAKRPYYPVDDTHDHDDHAHGDGGHADGGHDHGDHAHDFYRDAGTLPPGPETLSETGLYSDIAARALAPGVIAFAPRYELWIDGAYKKRWIWLPDGGKIDNSDPDNWVFPVGTKAWIEIGYASEPLETRVLMKVRDGVDGWFPMAYVWNDDGTEATAVPGGALNVRGTGHDVPGQRDCGTCHDAVRDAVIGADSIQLSRPGANGPLSEWSAAGRFTNPVTEFEVPGDGSTEDALGYLHANCGHCHGEGNLLATKRDLRLRLKTTDQLPEQTGAYVTTIDVEPLHAMEDGSTHVVVRGQPDKSQLFTRMKLRDSTTPYEGDGSQMPPIWTEKRDEAGLAAVRAWIEALQ